MQGAQPAKERAVSDKHRKFIHLENIRNFEKRLETETDQKKIDLLIRLIEEEKIKWVSPVDSPSEDVAS
jgi:hypothetical protein